MTKLSLAITPG